jgi:hypothetical protein
MVTATEKMPAASGPVAVTLTSDSTGTCVVNDGLSLAAKLALRSVRGRGMLRRLLSERA